MHFVQVALYLHLFVYLSKKWEVRFCSYVNIIDNCIFVPKN